MCLERTLLNAGGHMLYVSLLASSIDCIDALRMSSSIRIEQIENNRLSGNKKLAAVFTGRAFRFRVDNQTWKSKRSRFMTLVQAATKSFTNFSFASDWA